MRIAQITYSYTPVVGGADVYARLLHETFLAAGWESVVYQAPRPGAGGDEVRLIPATLLSRSGRGQFWTAPLGLRHSRRELEGFDVLVAHYANYQWPVAWHPRTILLSHGVWWDDRPKALRSRIKRALSRRACASSAAVVANDTFFLREMGLAVEPGAAPHAEVAPRHWFVPNGVDTGRFSPREGPADPPRILVPRNLYRNRGVHLAIEAMALLAAETDAVMEIAGADGQPAYAAWCRRRAAELGLEGRVRFLGPTPWERMGELYRAAAVTLIPTLCGEGTSLAALESMACGTPCVGTAVAGLLDLPVVHAAPEPTALARALERTLRERDDLARSQRESVVRDYSLARWAESWLRIVRTVAPR